MTQEEQAQELFAAGETVCAIAKKLGVSWYVANKLKGGEKPHALKPANNVKKPKPEAEADVVYDLPLQVASSQFDRILAAFTVQEKADAIVAILQGRINNAFGTVADGE